ncbi:KAP family P-loop NTPase fold protein [Microtetraspora malaysiensis]|uniref:KAP family P-loop NTPase fold protein n=1 Tax=Microtetraspora malaysiensis TaxID=161358 RepID=UPI003D8F3CBF
MGRKAYAEHLVRILNRVRTQGDSSVIALIGPWGSGKSSVLAMTSSILKEQKEPNEWLVAEYNPWIYSGLDSLLLGFFAELREVLPEEGKWSEKRAKIKDFGKAAAPFAALVPGVSAESVNKAAEWAGGDTSASKKRDLAAKALRELDRPILVILDDLDRLEPTELLLVFKLVRLLGRLPNVYYLLSFDEQTILDVLSQTDLVGHQKARARDYLEKMVQVRLDLPAFRERQRQGIVDSTLNAILSRYEQTLREDDQYRIGRSYYYHIQDRLTTPRAINRFMAQIDAVYETVVGEVNFTDFFLITFLRTFESGVYSLLQQHREELTGAGLRSLSVRNQPPSERLATWRKRLTESGVHDSHVEGIISVLALLFAPIRAASENANSGSGAFSEIEQRRGVGSADYFDRYFTFGVPEEDIADSVLRRALQDLSEGTSGPELKQLQTRLLDDTGRAVRKLRAMREEGDVPSSDLLILLAAIYGNLPDVDSLFHNPKRTIIFFVGELLQDVTAADGMRLLRLMGQEDTGLKLVVDIVRRLPLGDAVDDESSLRALSWAQDARDITRELIAKRLYQLGQGPLVDAPDDIFSMVLVWKHLAKEDATAWAQGQIESGNLPLRNVLGRLVTTAMTYASGKPRRVLDNLDFAVVEDLLGLDLVFRELGPDIDAADLTLDRIYDHEPNPELREKFALAELNRYRARSPEKLPGVVETEDDQEGTSSTVDSNEEATERESKNDALLEQ